MTPTMAGTNYHWQIGVDDVVIGSVFDIETKRTAIFPLSLTHLSIYKEFPDVCFVVHAYPLFANALIAKSTPIPSFMRATDELGNLEYHEEAEPYSQDQANKIVKGMKKMLKKCRRLQGLFKCHGMEL